MTFLTTLALAVALLVVAPWVAHRLRRRSAEEQPFPPARLVPPAPPQARRRSRLEDRALFATRAAAVVLLALLGATPFVRCSRLSLQRSGGASVAMALVVDDSMSMRAHSSSGRSRFERARDGARELLASAREGDAVAVVLAGAPARVALAATTDLDAARTVLDGLVESDRATDLDGALALARGLVSSLPQVDRRIVLLSDLADGRPDAPAVGEGSPVPVWLALPELRGAIHDCAVMRADRSGARVRVHVACGPGATAAGRDAIVEDGSNKVLGHAAPPTGAEGDTTVLLPSDSAMPVRARLSGNDAVASDDVAPVLTEAARGAVAVIADAADETVATGGAPIVEQALSALKLDVEVRPMPAFPDRAEDLAGTIGVLLDDPPGLTPEQRHALGAFLDGGGVALIALGPHVASAPLGASLEPVLAHAVGWTDTGVHGADPASAVDGLAESAQSLADLSTTRRATLAPEDIGAWEPLVRWSDGAPLVARRAVGRGEVWIVTLPFSPDASDLPLRPAFLAMLDVWTTAAREHASPRRSDVGTAWKMPGAHEVTVEGPAGPVSVARDDGVARVVPPVVGVYRLTVDGKSETRVAAPDVRELDLRPRAASSGAVGEAVGERRASVDVSGPIALVLLALVAAEMALRTWSRRKTEAV
ncbi:MAG TPA: BatA and WFA domain-containing protein [Polyangiaceae bacterium]